MASFISDAGIETSTGNGFPKRLMILAGLIVLADWLFYEQSVGISFALFVLVLAAAVIAGASHQGFRRGLAIHVFILFIALAPLVESFGFLSGLIGAMGIAYFTIAVTTALPSQMSAKLIACGRLLLSGPLRYFEDVARAIKIISHSGQKTQRIGKLAVWAVPLVVTGVFTALFASANPLIGDWFSRIDLWSILSLISLPRLAFWLLILVAIWPFVFLKPIITAGPERPASQRLSESIPGADLVFGQAAILRTVLLCNILFAIQTISDVAYLWVGVALPEGMTYAAYAHRGAYLLIITALLAGGFVIAAMRPGSTAERSPWTRGLVYLWIAQNILLVLSSALRLNLYVEAYSLTCWRAAAFVWMFLVAIGLVAIIVRIVLYRSNSWLVSTMLYMSMVTLYACSFVDAPRLIAAYNVAHCREITGKGAALDQAYLATLGPGVIPALDAYRQQIPEQTWHSGDVEAIRQHLVDAQLESMGNWRAWSFRLWRLKLYLDEQVGGSNASAAQDR